ncbi:complement C1r subcomponent [Bombina bombina]|uniref:complement C1r subcomponent n=1 Tax=Bombina bombina TaxID=8345 RepID=UPI00235AD812|nr:complement C1r subcomponent [Bombina bombina]
MFYWVILILGTVICSTTNKPLYGIITSPNYPHPYPNNNRSIWDISVPEGHHISLTFLLFDLEPSLNCDYDFVKVLADQRELGQFCGNFGSRFHPGQQRLVSQGTQMRIEFSSDFSNEVNGSTILYQGFQAYYRAEDTDECSPPKDNAPWNPPCEHVCHNYMGSYYCSCFVGYQLQDDQRSCKVECSSQQFTEEYGFISSPGYPKPYPPNLNCNYSIRLEKGLIISLSFHGLFEIDSHPRARCPYDTLKIYSGGQLQDTFCGNHSPKTLRTQSNSVDIVFQTDESGDSRGWRLKYRSEAIQCPRLAPLDDFSIISPWQDEYRMHEYVAVTCKTGYKLMEGKKELHSFTSLCQKDGTWHRALPRCEIVSCEEPQSLRNGKYTFLTTTGTWTYQSVIVYTCNTPYYIMVHSAYSAHFTCSAQRKWEDESGGSRIPYCVPVCGRPEIPLTSIGRIIGGEKAEIGNFPWQVFVAQPTRGGAVLIDEYWVLTAAHVLMKSKTEKTPVDDIKLFMGHVEVDELIMLTHYPVKEFYAHPDYNPINYDNDIALIHLQHPVVMNQNVSPICLPDTKNEILYAANKIGYVSGFGKTEDNMITNNLLYVPVPMVSRDKCQRYVDSKRKISKNYIFSQNMFCAGLAESSIKKKDSCQGDSGGPFAYDNNGTWMLTGLVSWGINCGQGYGFYTKVNNYIDWIQRYIIG